MRVPLCDLSNAGSSTAGCDQPAPLISVIIPHLNDLRRLTRCIEALNAQSLERETFEIIVADNGSDCGIEAVERAAEGARVVSVLEKGAGPARNGALALARGQILAFTDSDCIPDRNWLVEGRAALESSDLVGGRMFLSVADPARPTAVEAFELVFAFDNKRYVERMGFSVTANLFVRRAVGETIGGFQVGVPEDVDWCRRARSAGFRLCYSPQAIVAHPARHSMHELISKWQRLTEEAYGDLQVNGGKRWMWLARSAAVLISPLYDAIRVMTTHRLTGSAPRLAASMVLLRIRALRAWWMLQLLGQTSTSHYAERLAWMHAIAGGVPKVR